MSVEALWSITFGSVSGKEIETVSGGIVVLETERIFGGDTWTYFTGRYEVKGDSIKIDVQTGVHFTAGGQSIFGGPLTPYRFAGQGRINSDQSQIYVELTVAGSPNKTLAAVLRRVAELP
jgi:hypothetical protein